MPILEELKDKANGAADKANNIQEAISMMEFGGGSGGAGMVVNVTLVDGARTLDKTWQEIKDAMESGQHVVVVQPNIDGYPAFVAAVTCVMAASMGSDHWVYMSLGPETLTFTCQLPNEYPTI